MHGKLSRASDPMNPMTKMAKPPWGEVYLDSDSMKCDHAKITIRSAKGLLDEIVGKTSIAVMTIFEWKP